MQNELEAAGTAVQQFATAVSATTTGAEVDGIFATRARGRHFRVQIKVLERAYRDAASAGLPPSVVQPKVLAPLLASAGLEDEADEPMLGRWGHLLANAATASPAHVPPAFVDILRQLESLDAQVLEAAFDEGERRETTPDPPLELTRSSIAGLLHLEPEVIGQARLDNLMRLELLRPVQNRVDRPLTWNDLKSGNRLLLTDLGSAFVAACRAPEASG